MTLQEMRVLFRHLKNTGQNFDILDTYVFDGSCVLSVAAKFGVDDVVVKVVGIIIVSRDLCLHIAG